MAKADETAEKVEETKTDPAIDPAAEVAAEAPASDPDRVSYRVLKAGDGKIHTGKHDHETNQPGTFSKGDVVPNTPRAIAEGLEDRGYAEILED